MLNTHGFIRQSEVLPGKFCGDGKWNYFDFISTQLCTGLHCGAIALRAKFGAFSLIFLGQ